MLPDENRLRLATDFNRLRKNGNKFVHPLVVLVYIANQQNDSRFAFPASRKVGGAVQRNRARRLLREAVRYHLEDIKPGIDCILIARSKTTQANLNEVVNALDQLLKRADLKK
ncbi:MAG: ribonuclease P protein component [Chloroflexota bacterium]